MEEQRKLTRIKVTMRDLNYTATACGFDFVDGVAVKDVNLEIEGRDTVALGNVLSLFPGTHYERISDTEIASQLAEEKKAEEIKQTAIRDKIREEERAKLVEEMKEGKASNVKASKSDAPKSDAPKADATKGDEASKKKAAKKKASK